MQLTEAVAAKVLKTVDAGLVHGMGRPKAGSMCVEAAVCFALGLPHGDNPPCVGGAVRAYKIRINDQSWSSDTARAKGMRRVAIAQLGSNEIDQRAFADYVIVEGVKRILPIALKAALRRATGAQAVDINAAIAACEAVASMSDARQAASLSKKAAAAYTAADAAYAAAAYADAYAAAAAARDSVLSLAADIAVEALQKLNCKGCEWLFLCDA